MVSVASAVLLVTACSAAEPRPVETVRTYALLTEQRLMVVAGDTARFTADGDFPRDGSSLVWTGDGRYVVTATGADEEHRALIVMNGENGETRNIPCPDCQDLATISGARAVLADSQHGLSILDAERGTLTKIPSQVRFYTLGLRVLDASGERVLVAGADIDMVSAYGGPEDLYEVTLSGQTRSLGSTEANTPVRAEIGPDGQVALISGWHAGACAEGSSVSLLPARKPVDDPAVPIPDADGIDGVTGPYLVYHHVWFAADGRPHAIASAWKCTGSGDSTIPEQPVVVSAVLEGARWALVQDVPPGQEVLMRWRDGTLTVAVNGTPTKIAAETVAVAMKPG